MEMLSLSSFLSPAVFHRYNVAVVFLPLWGEYLLVIAFLQLSPTHGWHEQDSLAVLYSSALFMICLKVSGKTIKRAKDARICSWYTPYGRQVVHSALSFSFEANLKGNYYHTFGKATVYTPFFRFKQKRKPVSPENETFFEKNTLTIFAHKIAFCTFLYLFIH